MAAVMSVLFTATGLIDVIIPPHRARAERKPREGLYCNDLVGSLRVTRLTLALFEPAVAQPDHLIERRRAVPTRLHALDESSGHAMVARPAQLLQGQPLVPRLLERLSLQELRRARDHGVTRGFIQRVKARGYGTPSLDEVIRLRDRGLD